MISQSNQQNIFGNHDPWLVYHSLTVEHPLRKIATERGRSHTTFRRKPSKTNHIWPFSALFWANSFDFDFVRSILGWAMLGVRPEIAFNTIFERFF